MELIRCSEQTRDLFKYYTEFLGEPATGGILSVVDLLHQVEPRDLKVYLLVSHHRICLLSEDDSATPQWVVIDKGDPHHKFKIDCLVPKHSAPWEWAYVYGYADTVSEAVKKVQAGITFSEGWLSS